VKKLKGGNIILTPEEWLIEYKKLCKGEKSLINYKIWAQVLKLNKKIENITGLKDTFLVEVTWNGKLNLFPAVCLFFMNNINHFYQYGNVNTNDFRLNKHCIGHWLGISEAMVDKYYLRAKNQLRLIDIEKMKRVRYTRWMINVYARISIKKINKYLIKHYNLDSILLDCSTIFFTMLNKHNKDKEIEKAQELYKDDAKKLKKEIKKIERKYSNLKKLRKQEKAKKLAKQYPHIMEVFRNLEKPFNDTYLEEGKLRSTNELCNTRNPEKELLEHIENCKKLGIEPTMKLEDTERYQQIYKKFGKTEVYDYDTNGSIYRIQLYISKGIILEPEEDVYEYIYKHCKFNKPWSKEVRKIFKLLLMPIFMKPYTIEHKEYLLPYKIRLYNKYDGNIDGKSKELVETATQCNNLIGDYITVSKRIRVVMKELFGDTLREEIFIIESNLHTLILEQLTKISKWIVNVYDCMYTNFNVCYYYNLWNDKLYEVCSYIKLAQ
jgi:predicted transcriptional regulator